MNTEFSRIITLLRKEKKLSQKQVAKDLGISQALLSHYEKGIRECGLDFIIKTSEYYGVSCDYLLGKTIERNGAKISFDDISNSEASVNYGSLLSQLNKKLIQNSTNLLFDVAESTHNKEIEIAVSDYLMTSVYKMFRILYSSNSQNPQAMFSLPKETYCGYSSAFQHMKETEIYALSNGTNIKNHDAAVNKNAPELSQKTLAEQYPEYSAAMFNLIKMVENNIKL